MGDNGTAGDKDTGGSVRVRRSFGILGRGPILTYHLPIRQEGSRVDIIGCIVMNIIGGIRYDSIATVGEIRVYWRADFQSASRVLKKVF